MDGWVRAFRQGLVKVTGVRRTASSSSTATCDQGLFFDLGRDFFESEVEAIEDELRLRRRNPYLPLPPGDKESTRKLWDRLQELRGTRAPAQETLFV